MDGPGDMKTNNQKISSIYGSEVYYRVRLWAPLFLSSTYLPSEVEEGVNQSPQTATAWGPSIRKGAVCLFIGTAAPQSFIK